MLHFLIGVALCIFIGERVARFLEHRRQQRNFKRGMELLNPPPLVQPIVVQASAPLPWPTLKPVSLEPDRWVRYAIFAVWGLCGAFVIASALAG